MLSSVSPRLRESPALNCMVLKKEIYTQRAKRVLFFSRCEATQHGGPPVQAEHLLLGLVDADPELLQTLSHTSNDVISYIRAAVESKTPFKASFSTRRELPPLSQSAEQSLDLAAAESQKLNHNYIGTEHILIGLLDHTSLASHILNELEFNLEEASSRIAGGSTTPQ